MPSSIFAKILNYFKIKLGLGLGFFKFKKMLHIFLKIRSLEPKFLRNLWCEILTKRFGATTFWAAQCRMVDTEELTDKANNVFFIIFNNPLRRWGLCGWFPFSFPNGCRWCFIYSCCSQELKEVYGGNPELDDRQSSKVDLSGRGVDAASRKACCWRHTPQGLSRRQVILGGGSSLEACLY